VNRRTFIYNAALGTLALAGRSPLLAASPGQTGSGPEGGTRVLRGLRIDVQAPDMTSPLGMPGLFPGRVMQTTHAGVLSGARIVPDAVREMVARGMTGLTGERTVADAFARFIDASDVVALKVNPSGAPTTTTAIPLVREVVRCLNLVGVPNRRIVVYDRNSNQLEVLGYHQMLPPGVRVVGLDQRWIVEGTQRPGYDPDVFCEMNCFGERETRSYLASVVATEATKIINLPCLKEHNASGVTGCLKNLAYGSFNNVARTHVRPRTFTDPVIAVMCDAPPVRSKSVLHIMDGIRAVYHAGPFSWNPEFHWDARTLLFGTDPVAVDRLELEIVEAKRREVGVPSLSDHNPEYLAGPGEMERTAFKNNFYREPGHIRTAGQIGLGEFELARIDHRHERLG
jgi:uncharacterized protein (DUF362 family)